MKDSGRTIMFAAVLGLACALLLSMANIFTAPYFEANRRAEEVRNILGVMGIPTDPDMDSKRMLEIFDKHIRAKEWRDLVFFEYVGDEAAFMSAVAVPFSGSGVWGPVKGVISLESDWMVIKDIRFYQQEETPGLGGEIGSDWFELQFKGKRIVSDSGDPGFFVVRHDEPSTVNSVHAITGATMTSERIERILDELAKELAEVRENNAE